MSQPLPQVYEQIVDWTTVDQLLFDIGAAARLLEVMVKGGSQGYARESTADLTTARAALRAGAAVQLRYLHDAAEWWDTLLPIAEDRIRIVRTRPPAI